MDSFDIMMVALRFNEKINQQDLNGLVELMTDDHTFIDNSGDSDKNMKEGWKEFFKNHPGYRNIFTSVTVKNNVVACMPHIAVFMLYLLLLYKILRPRGRRLIVIGLVTLEFIRKA